MNESRGSILYKKSIQKLYLSKLKRNQNDFKSHNIISIKVKNDSLRSRAATENIYLRKPIQNKKFDDQIMYKLPRSPIKDFKTARDI